MFTLNCSIHKHRDIMRICPIASLATHLISWLLSKIVQLKSDVSHKRDILIVNKSHYKLNSQLAKRIEVIFSWQNYRRPNSQNYGGQFQVETDPNTLYLIVNLNYKHKYHESWWISNILCVSVFCLIIWSLWALKFYQWYCLRKVKVSFYLENIFLVKKFFGLITPNLYIF